MPVPATRGASTDVDVYDEDDTGLDDLEHFGGVILPRIVIEHEDGVFKDSLTGELIEELICIPLGIVGQRVLWPPTITEEASDPLCKSLDMKTATPGDDFPWDASGFTAEDLGEDGHLNCTACPLKDWGSHPDPSKESSWCTEQIVLVVLRQEDDETVSPALITFQRSSIAPARKYLQAFRNKNKGPFINLCAIGLTTQKRGKNTYSVPTFTKQGSTPSESWKAFAEQFRSIRTFLRTPRVDVVEEVVEAPKPAPRAAAKTAKAAPPTVSVPNVEDDDEPF